MDEDSDFVQVTSIPVTVVFTSLCATVSDSRFVHKTLIPRSTRNSVGLMRKMYTPRPCGVLDIHWMRLRIRVSSSLGTGSQHCADN